LTTAADVAAYKTLVFAVAFSVDFAVALAVLFAAGTAGFGHVSGLTADGDPQYPPYISTTVFLGLPSPEAKVQQISKTIALSLQALTSAVSNK
jgi:hypothetical protein